MEYKPQELPSIAEMYGNLAPEGTLSEMRAEAKKAKEQHKKNSAGPEPTKTWTWNNQEVKANTKSEARGKMKKLGLTLPAGAKVKLVK